MMLVVVPREKLGAESVRILITTKALGKLRAIFHGLELALRVPIVIGDIGPAVGLGHSQFSQEKSHGLRCHRRSPIRMHRESPRKDIVALKRLLDEFLGQLPRLPLGQHPAHHVAAKYI